MNMNKMIPVKGNSDTVRRTYVKDGVEFRVFVGLTIVPVGPDDALDQTDLDPAKITTHKVATHLGHICRPTMSYLYPYNVHRGNAGDGDLAADLDAFRSYIDSIIDNFTDNIQEGL